MKHSEQLNEIAGAIAKAQAEMQGAKKGSTNPFFSSKYADLGAVMAATKEALHNHGLSVVQFPIAADGKCGVSTMLLHESGQYITEDCLLACSKQDPQAYGSAITYARRYGWQAVCGIPSEDDDGNSAMQSKIDLENEARDLWELKKDSVPQNIANNVFSDIKSNPQKAIDYLKEV
jgi:hypothetical protein